MDSPTDNLAASPAIEAIGLCRDFRTGALMRRHRALEDVSLTVRRGETVGLVGPNGSGKSTLLRILAGVDRPTLGHLRVLGGPVDLRETRRRTSFLPDGSPFPGELTARAALALIGSLKGLPRGEAKQSAMEMLDRVGLGDRSGTRLRAFSRGMHRRFGLAQAFMTRPDVVLLDEPTAGLDAPGFDVIDGLLREAKAGGTTVVIASHVASDLVEHCDGLVLLREGRRVATGTPDELLGRTDATDLRVTGPALDASGALVTRVTEALAACSVEVEHARPARRSLADLYGESKETGAES